MQPKIHHLIEQEKTTIGYYKALYVNQGNSGLFRDSASYNAMRIDIGKSQEEVASRIIYKQSPKIKKKK